NLREVPLIGERQSPTTLSAFAPKLSATVIRPLGLAAPTVDLASMLRDGMETITTVTAQKDVLERAARRIDPEEYSLVEGSWGRAVAIEFAMPRLRNAISTGPDENAANVLQESIPEDSRGGKPGSTGAAKARSPAETSARIEYESTTD